MHEPLNTRGRQGRSPAPRRPRVQQVAAHGAPGGKVGLRGEMAQPGRVCGAGPEAGLGIVPEHGQGLVAPAQYGIYCLVATAILRNNVFIRNVNEDLFVSLIPGVITRESNATEDLTGDAGVTGIVPANEFASLTYTDTDYLFLNGGALSGAFTRDPAGDVLINQKIHFTPSLTYVPGSAVLGRYGVAPAYATEDIAGVPRPGSSGWYSIGCHEEEYS